MDNNRKFGYEISGNSDSHPIRSAKWRSTLRLFCGSVAAAVLTLMLAACGGGAGPAKQSSSQASAPSSTAPSSAAPSKLDKVKVGHVGAVSDAGIYIALEKGFFKEQGIEVELVQFDTGDKEIAPLGTGQLDVGGGAVSAGLFNAVNRGINVKIVADKGSTFKGFGYEGIMVASGQVDKLKRPADFKKKKVGLLSISGTAPEAALNKWLKQDGLTTKDVEMVQIPLANMGTALSTGAVDAVQIVESAMTSAVVQGFGKVLLRDDEFYPGHMLGVLMYSEAFANKSDVAERFMTAYLQGIRFFDDAFVVKDEKKRAEAIDILMSHGKLKDHSMYEKMTLAGLNPNGEVNLDSMKEDQEYFLWRGYQEKKMNMEALVDTRFARKALEKLGRR